MRALTDALRNRKTRIALEADFRQYYHLSIKGIREGTGEVSYPEAARLLSQLPRESRLFKIVMNDPLTQQDHLLLSLIDASRLEAFFSMVNAQAQVGKHWSKVIKNMPKPIPRPGQEEPKKTTVVVRSKDAKAAVNRIMQSSVAKAITGG